MTYAEFVAEHKISAEVSRTNINPNMEDSLSMDNWRVTLKASGRKMTVYFSKGKAHKGAAPTADEVLECLAMDSSYDGYQFEEWCNELGYDTDSRKAHRTHQVCMRQSERLRKFMGANYDALATVEF